MGVRNINLDFLQDHQDLSQKVLFFISIEPGLKFQGNTHKFSMSPGCIRTIPLNPPLQKGEAVELLGLIENLLRLDVTH